jgi:hypothetical protein
MANECNVVVHRSVEKFFNDGEWILCFQEGTWEYTDPNRENEQGYRFIWKRPDGSLQARGAARLPSIKDMIELMALFHCEERKGKIYKTMPDQFRDTILLKLISSVNDICDL